MTDHYRGGGQIPVELSDADNETVRRVRPLKR